MPTTYPTSCQEYYNWGLRTNTNFYVDTDGEEGAAAPTIIPCDFTGMDTSKCHMVQCCYEAVSILPNQLWTHKPHRLAMGLFPDT